ncbi:hypothetical protein QFC21_002658 [Naganishia friedmannii]|uniref:Uncharacterized protein n=1 Tax=Naganishia friedmannii TaxID=89922 RepID=A0ACC2VVV7_9TREE|nr:hypothetical protein QFC21_002658 [Naganishia friedmannii]
MFIGGLNWETTDEGLSAYFSQFGVVKDCCIMRDPTGRSRGFAFLTFADPSVIPDVLKRDHNVDGKIIDPKRAIPKAEHAKSQKIFVGGLAPSVTNASLGEFFQQFGGVVDAHVMLDRETSRNKGFGFVTFEDFAGVDRAMQAQNLILDGRPVEIKRAQPKHVRDQQSYNSEWQRPIGSFMSHEAQSSKYKHNAAGGPMGGNPMGGMGMGMGMNPMGNMMGGGGGGGGGGGNGFDPNAMATMYQKMMMNMMMNPMMMNMMNQNKMAGGAGMANPMMGGMMCKRPLNSHERKLA